MSWTEERVERLKTLWSEGFSASQCAVELGGGITRNAVIGKITRLGLSMRATKMRAVVRARPAPMKPGRMALHSGTAAVLHGVGAPPSAPDTRRVAQAPAPLDEAGKAEARALPALAGSILELRDDMCKFPSDGTGGLVFCGRAALDGSPYCAAHHALCLNPPSKPPSSPEPRVARAGERRERVIDCVEAFGSGR